MGRRAEEQARIREVLIALGGSPDALDRPNDGSAQEPVSPESRIAAYTRIRRIADVPVPTAAEALVHDYSAQPTPTPVEVVPKPMQYSVRRNQAARAPRTNDVAHAARVLARRLTVAARALTLLAVDAVRLLARLTLRAVRGVVLLLLGATLAARAFARPLPRVASALMRSAVDATTALMRSPSVPRRSDQRQKRRSARADLTLRAVPAVLVALVAIVAVTLKVLPDNNHGSGQTEASAVARAQGSAPTHTKAPAATQTQRTAATAQTRASAVTATADSVASRSGFSNPLAYAGAMSRLALTNGRTQVDGEPACDRSSTWKQWTCLARGRPSLGPYAGRRLTYRCEPRSAPQPAGPTAVLVNCTPVNPPPLTT